MPHFIRTVAGDISAADLGVCYPHEHLFGSPPPHLAKPDFVLDEEAAALREMKWFKEAGGQALVDMSTMDYGRDPAALLRVSEQTGVHIVCATGFNKDPFSREIVDGMSDEELVDTFVGDIESGIGGTGIRAGVLKAASTLNEISPTALRVFEAVAAAHLVTGAPVSTHTEAGTMALEQVALLTRAGVLPEHIIIGHLDRKLDWPYIKEVAQAGVFLGFDQISKEKYYPDRVRIEFISKLFGEGFGAQILLSGDLARRSYWPSYGSGGGPGFTYILWRFIPWLREAGLDAASIRELLVANPARALAFAG